MQARWCGLPSAVVNQSLTHIVGCSDCPGFAAKLWRERAARALGEEAAALFAGNGPAPGGGNGRLMPGDRTDTGSAFIAGDPHRFTENPGAYQQMRLACPEYDVVGLAVPGVPGLAHSGHTGTAAWAVTHAMADSQDLYSERLRHLEDGRIEALGPDGAWEPVARHTETIAVTGADPVEVEVLETARGPVIVHGDAGDAGDGDGDGGGDEASGAAGGRALSLRHTSRVRHDLGFAALPALLRARSVADVDAALDGWAEPVNVVHAADSAGGLLHRVAGAVPLRDPAARLRPVPASDARHAWRGWAKTPAEPVQGFAVMANARGIASPLGVEFAPPHRTGRIRELLSGSADWSPKAMAGVHADTHLASAAPLLALLPALDGLSPAAAALRTRLLGWDRHRAADSADAAAFSACRAATVRSFAAAPGCTSSPASAMPSRGCSPPACCPAWTAPPTSAPPWRRPRPGPAPSPVPPASPPPRRRTAPRRPVTTPTRMPGIR